MSKDVTKARRVVSSRKISIAESSKLTATLQLINEKEASL